MSDTSDLQDVVTLDHAASGMLLRLPAATRLALACASRSMRDLHNAYISAEEQKSLLLRAHRAYHCERYERWVSEHRARWKRSILDDMALLRASVTEGGLGVPLRMVRLACYLVSTVYW